MDRYALSQQVFEACVQFYVVLVQVTKELVRAENLRNSDQLEDQSKYSLLVDFPQIVFSIKQTRKVILNLHNENRSL